MLRRGQVNTYRKTPDLGWCSWFSAGLKRRWSCCRHAVSRTSNSSMPWPMLVFAPAPPSLPQRRRPHTASLKMPSRAQGKTPSAVAATQGTVLHTDAEAAGEERARKNGGGGGKAGHAGRLVVRGSHRACSEGEGKDGFFVIARGIPHARSPRKRPETMGKTLSPDAKAFVPTWAPLGVSAPRVAPRGAG